MTGTKSKSNKPFKWYPADAGIIQQFWSMEGAGHCDTAQAEPLVKQHGLGRVLDAIHTAHAQWLAGDQRETFGWDHIKAALASQRVR